MAQLSHSGHVIVKTAAKVSWGQSSLSLTRTGGSFQDGLLMAADGKG